MAGLGQSPSTPRKVAAPVALTPEHDVSRFTSGRQQLDDWLKNLALESEGRTARTYVACEGNRVVGYYCISTGGVERRDLPAPLKRARGTPNTVPVAIIGRLARDVSFVGTGLGQDLLQDALRRILAASRVVGLRAILVHALDEQAARFWSEHEFIESPIGSGIFYLPIETVAQAI